MQSLTDTYRMQRMYTKQKGLYTSIDRQSTLFIPSAEIENLLTNFYLTVTLYDNNCKPYGVPLFETVHMSVLRVAYIILRGLS